VRFRLEYVLVRVVAACLRVLPMSAVRRVVPLPLGPDGRHVFPELEP